MKKIYYYISNLTSLFWLDGLSLLLLALTVVSAAGVLLIWFKIHFSSTALFFSLGVLLANTMLALYTGRREPVASQFLLATAFLIQIFFLILIKYTVYSY